MWRSKQTQGEALQIVSMRTSSHPEAKRTKELALDRENLDKIQRAIPEGLGVACVSVTGDFRTGKSVLLNHMKHLLEQKRDEELPPGLDWISAKGGALRQPALFGWRAGEDSVTNGIWIWNVPFVCTAQDGGKVAVLLMDTQGFGDESEALDTAVFSLSALVSSHQIFNIQNRLSERELGHVAAFTRFAQRLADAGVANSSSPAGSGKPCQRMEFLVRDVNCSSSSETVDDWHCKANETFTKMMAMGDRSASKERVRQLLHAGVEELKYSQLPRPSDAVTRSDYDGSPKAMGAFFGELLDCFLRRTFSKSALQAKSLNGVGVLDAELWCSMFEKYAQASRHGPPDAQSLLDAQISLAHERAEAEKRNEAHERELCRARKRALARELPAHVLKGAALVGATALTIVVGGPALVAAGAVDAIAAVSGGPGGAYTATAAFITAKWDYLMNSKAPWEE